MIQEEVIALAKRERFSVQADPKVVDAARNAVFWTPGLTLADLVEEGLRKVVADLERKNGAPFKKRKSALKAGRPVR